MARSAAPVASAALGDPHAALLAARARQRASREHRRAACQNRRAVPGAPNSRNRRPPPAGSVPIRCRPRPSLHWCANRRVRGRMRASPNEYRLCGGQNRASRACGEAGLACSAPTCGFLDTAGHAHHRGSPPLRRESTPSLPRSEPWRNGPGRRVEGAVRRRRIVLCRIMLWMSGPSSTNFEDRQRGESMAQMRIERRGSRTRVPIWARRAERGRLPGRARA